VALPRGEALAQPATGASAREIRAQTATSSPVPAAAPAGMAAPSGAAGVPGPAGPSGGALFALSLAALCLAAALWFARLLYPPARWRPVFLVSLIERPG
jgi:hypothetical protein